MIIYRYISIVSLLYLALIVSNDIWSMEQQPLFNEVEGLCSIDASLFQAVKNSDSDLINQALKNGANVNAQNKKGDTALMLAAENGNESIIRLLLDRGADVKIQANFGMTALRCAYYAAYDKPATLEILLNLLLECGADINASLDNGDTVLMSATRNRDKEAAQLLIKKGAYINTQDIHGKTALMHVVKSLKYETSDREKYLDILALLLLKGADCNVLDRKGHSILLQVIKPSVFNRNQYDSYEKCLWVIESNLLIASQIIDNQKTNDQNRVLKRLLYNNFMHAIIRGLLQLSGETNRFIDSVYPYNLQIDFYNDIKYRSDTYMRVIDYYMYIIEKLLARGAQVHNKNMDDVESQIFTLRDAYKEIKAVNDKKHTPKDIYNREIGNKKLLVRKIKDSKKRLAEDAALDENNNNNKKQARTS